MVAFYRTNLTTKLIQCLELTSVHMYMSTQPTPNKVDNCPVTHIYMFVKPPPFPPMVVTG